MLDMGKLGDKMKVFQRRATQKVLQGMGMADKTTDDNDQQYQNFSALGSFANQLKATIQATDSSVEKLCTAQSHLAGQIQSYLHTEFNGDADLPPGDMYEFFSSNSADSQMHAALLLDVAEKFYGAFSEIGTLALRTLVTKLEDNVVRPVSKDEEYNALTRQLLEEKKGARTDYDSYRRSASSMEQDRAEVKVRQAKEKYDIASRRFAEHLEVRNRMRCKMLVHGVLTAFQQYHKFYSVAADILKDTSASIKPLLDVYQLDEQELLDTINLEKQLSNQGNHGNNGNNTTAGGKYNYLFEGQPQNGAPVRPTAKPAAKPSGNTGHGNTPRNQSPMRDTQINEQIFENIAGIKNKPAAGNPSGKPSGPMNAMPPTRTPTATSPPPVHTPPPAQNSSPSTAKPSLVDPFADWDTPTSTPSPTTQASAGIIDIDINIAPTTTSPTPQPAKPAPSLYDEIFNPPLEPTLLQPQQRNSPVPPARPAAVPQQNRGAQPGHVSPTPGFGQGASPDLFGFGSTPSQPAKPAASRGPLDDLDSMFGPTPTPAPTPANNFGGNNRPTPAATTGYAATQQQQKQEQDARGELNPAVTQKIQNWAEKGGRATNLRALISTMHEVIWVDSGWDGLSLAELVTTDQVKKAYRRANMVVHPDKIANGTVEQKLIAQRLFEALRVSYEAFSRDELNK